MSPTRRPDPEVVERRRQGKRKKAEQFQDIGGPPPYGLRRNDWGQLERVPEEVATFKYMLEARRQGASYHAIAKRLTARGVPTREGGKWHDATVYRILNNPIYYRTQAQIPPIDDLAAARRAIYNVRVTGIGNE